jgi:hypothetical protein
MWVFGIIECPVLLLHTSAGIYVAICLTVIDRALRARSNINMPSPYRVREMPELGIRFAGTGVFVALVIPLDV